MSDRRVFGPPTPILRSFDEARTRAFYLEYLEFELVFEHRCEPGLPLYLGLRRGDCTLHLSEHYGDATREARSGYRSTTSPPMPPRCA